MQRPNEIEGILLRARTTQPLLSAPLPHMQKPKNYSPAFFLFLFRLLYRRGAKRSVALWWRGCPPWLCACWASRSTRASRRGAALHRSMHIMPVLKHLW